MKNSLIDHIEAENQRPLESVIHMIYLTKSADDAELPMLRIKYMINDFNEEEYQTQIISFVYKN